MLTATRRVGVVLLGLSVVCGVAGGGRARAEATWEYRKLVDRATVVPGSGGLTYRSLYAPALDGDNLFFHGSTLSGSTTVRYICRLQIASNVLTTVAREGTASPDGTAYGGFLTAISCDGANVVYGDGVAVYASGPGYASTLVRSGNAIPGGGTFQSIRDGFAVDGTNYAFSGESSGTPQRAGVYLRRGRTGPIETIADWNTTIPGTAFKFNQRFYYLMGHKGAFYFTGGNSVEAYSGIFCWSNGVLARVVDTQTRVPGQAFGYFSGFQQIAADGDNLTFKGSYGGGSGIYKRIGAGEWEVVADSGTALPETPDPPLGYVAAGLDGNDVIFSGSCGSRKGGFYCDAGGSLQLLLSYTNGVLEGRPINELGIRVDHCFNANRFAFYASYYDLPANEAIWLGTVTVTEPPPPSGAVMVVR